MAKISRSVELFTCDLCLGPMDQKLHIDARFMPKSVVPEDIDIWSKVEICDECVEFIRRGLAKRVGVNKEKSNAILASAIQELESEVLK